MSLISGIKPHGRGGRRVIDVQVIELDEQPAAQTSDPFAQLRRRIAIAMTACGLGDRDPRHIEACLRDNPRYPDLGALDAAKLLELERAVFDAATTVYPFATWPVWHRRAELLGIPVFAYVPFADILDPTPTAEMVRASKALREAAVCDRCHKPYTLTAGETPSTEKHCACPGGPAWRPKGPTDADALTARGVLHG